MRLQSLQVPEILKVLGAAGPEVALVKTRYGTIAAYIGDKYQPMKVKGKVVVEISQEAKKYIR